MVCLLFFLLFFWLLRLSGIDTGGWYRVFLKFSVINLLLAPVVLVLFSLFADLINRLGKPKVSWLKILVARSSAFSL